MKMDNRNKSMGNSEKGVKREVVMDFKIVMTDMLKELNKREHFGRKLETKKSNGSSRIEKQNCNENYERV